MKKTIVIVHPFTSDKILYATIKSRGYTIITLITPLDSVWIVHCMDTINKFSDHVIKVQGIAKTDIPELELLCQENDLHIAGIINAFDYSLEYADSLVKHFTGIDLDLEFSRIRCNKFLVNDALAKNGVRHIKSVLLNNDNSLAKLSPELKSLSFPVVVKPASLSAARNHVMIAHDFNSLITIVRDIQQEKNIFTNDAITDIVVQEYVQGEEFIVNAVSLAGKHYIAGVFKYKKKDQRFFGVWSLNGSEADAVNKLINYTKQCLTALKVSYGITHNEFILDKQGNIYLIEMNNRLSGIEIPMLSQECYGSDEVSLFLDLIENKPPHEFALNKIAQYSCLPYLSNFVNPEATKLDLTDITSQYEIITFRPGVVTSSQQNDLFKKVSAALWLLNKDKSRLDYEVDLLFSRERNGLLFI